MKLYYLGYASDANGPIFHTLSDSLYKTGLATQLWQKEQRDKDWVTFRESFRGSETDRLLEEQIMQVSYPYCIVTLDRRTVRALFKQYGDDVLEIGPRFNVHTVEQLLSSGRSQ